MVLVTCWVIIHYTQCSPKVLGVIFLKIEDNFFFLILKISSTGICIGFCSCTVSEKQPKIPLFGPSVIHQLWLLGSQQHPHSGVLLNSFSTSGTENSLAEVNLESTGKGLRVTFFRVKNWPTFAAL